MYSIIVEHLRGISSHFSRTYQAAAILYLRQPCSLLMPVVHSPLPDEFDPFATHPFTDNSGITPKPPLPSAYPLYIPSSLAESVPRNHNEGTPKSLFAMASLASTDRPTQSTDNFAELRSPQPRKFVALNAASTSLSPARQVFEPFRQVTSTPELVLRKNSVYSHYTKSTIPQTDTDSMNTLGCPCMRCDHNL